MIDKGTNTISKQIEGLDKEAIGFVVSKDAEGLRKYMRDTDNTICGIHPILVALEYLNALAGKEIKG